MIAEQPAGRADYRVFYEIPTRWMDNDIYGHVNNVNYYSYFDTAIAYFLMAEGGLDPWRDPIVGFCVESGCRFHRGIRFPDRVTAGLRVTKVGRSSVRWEIGIFRNDEHEAAADVERRTARLALAGAGDDLCNRRLDLLPVDDHRAITTPGS